jgi:hypothetical protein
MFSSFTKRKLSDNQIANMFVNALFEATDNGFTAVAEMINEDAVFEVSPNLKAGDEGHFNLVVIAANLSVLESAFESDQAERIENLVFAKLGQIYSIDTLVAKSKIKEYQSLISRVNHPSKNVVYAMSKGVFHTYKLAQFQREAYFKSIGNPNPLFLKRLDEVMEMFLWDWDAFFKKYKFAG